MSEKSHPTSTDKTVPVDGRVVSCDGNDDDGALGHPRVYLAIGNEGEVLCPYCNRRFVLSP